MPSIQVGGGEGGSEPSKLNSSLPPSCYERVLTQQVNAINLEFSLLGKNRSFWKFSLLEVIRWKSNK